MGVGGRINKKLKKADSLQNSFLVETYSKALKNIIKTKISLLSSISATYHKLNHGYSTNFGRAPNVFMEKESQHFLITYPQVSALFAQHYLLLHLIKHSLHNLSALISTFSMVIFC
jgi:hypothetical protein